MTCEDVEPAVAEAVLLAAIRAQPFPPRVPAAGLLAEHETMAGCTQSVTQIVVVAVAEFFVQAANLLDEVTKEPIKD